MNQNGKLFTILALIPLLASAIHGTAVDGEESGITSYVDLDETGTKLQEDHQLYFYKYKTQFNLNFVNAILPNLESLQRNLTSLMTSNDVVFADFKTKHNSIESKLVSMEENIWENRQLLENYTAVYDNTVKEMHAIQENLIETISSQSELVRRIEL